MASRSTNSDNLTRVWLKPQLQSLQTALISLNETSSETATEDSVWMSNSSSHFSENVIAYPCSYRGNYLLVKWGTWQKCIWILVGVFSSLSIPFYRTIRGAESEPSFLLLNPLGRHSSHITLPWRPSRIKTDKSNTDTREMAQDYRPRQKHQIKIYFVNNIFINFALWVSFKHARLFS